MSKFLTKFNKELMWAKCKMRTLNTKLIFQINYGTYMYLKSDIKAGFYLLCFCNPILGNQPQFVSKYVQRYIRKLANTNTLFLIENAPSGPKHWTSDTKGAM